MPACPALLAVAVLASLPAPPGGQGTSNRAVSQAVELIQQGHLPAAEQQLLEGAATNPQSIQIQHLLGVVYERERKYSQAEEALERVVTLSSERDPQTLFLLCKVKFELKKTDEALALSKEIFEISGSDPRPLYAVGRLLRENSHAGAAIAELVRARSLAPQDPAVTAELIAAYLDSNQEPEARALLESLLRTGSYDELVRAGSQFGESNHLEAAVAAFERAVALRPSAYDGQFDLAFAYSRQGSPERSLEILDRLKNRRTSEGADYHYLRGKVEAALHRDQVAAADFREALRLQPDNESLCVDAGLFFSRFQDFRKALGIFQACSQKLGDSAAVETGLGLTYLRLGKYPDAIETFHSVLSLNVESDAAREALGFLLYISGRLPEARQVLEERMSAPKVDFYIYFLHALVLLRLDKPRYAKAAELSLNEALVRNPGFAPAYFQRGKLAFESGDLARGLGDLETATRLDPAYAQPYYLIAQIYFKQGNRAAAERAEARFNSLNRDREQKEQAEQVESRLIQALQ